MSLDVSNLQYDETKVEHCSKVKYGRGGIATYKEIKAYIFEKYGCIVYQTNKKTGEKYAYKSISYWDKKKKQPRSKRKYIGKVDSITGEIIKSRKASASLPHGNTANDSADMERLHEELAQKDSLI